MTRAILAIAFCSTCITHAASANPIGLAADFNVVTFGDFTSSNSDTEGRLAVGGNAMLANYGVGALLPMGFAGNGLIVGGNLSFNSGQVTQGGIAYGGVANLVNVGIPNGSAVQSTPLDFGAVQIDLQNRSAAFSQIDANGTIAVMFGKLELTGTDPDLNVFDVSSSDLAAANNVVIDVPPGSTVLINVNGASVDLSGFAFNGPGGGVLPIGTGQILFNLFEATSANISAIKFPGSILAPSAALEFNNGQINGTVIVESVTGGGQFNTAPFNGRLPIGDSPAAPEPSTLAVLMGGIVALAAARRYRLSSKRMR